jgi:hypothetical protein
LLGLGPWPGALRRCRFEQLIDALGGEFGQDGRATVAAAIGWNFGSFDPAAVGVGVEIIARGDFHIHAGQVGTVHLRCRDTGQQ